MPMCTKKIDTFSKWCITWKEKQTKPNERSIKKDNISWQFLVDQLL